ncbi:MAG: hypothetical protein JNN07_14710 [Verrucomicrobiales bacterium]|nr:hypothetical protein [Verrucomicrobiales bacterium]
MKIQCSLPWLRTLSLSAGALSRSRWSLLMILLLCGVVPGTSAQTAAPPEFMTYQGFLTDANGVPLGANNPLNYTITFKVYGSPTGEDALWGETQIVTVDKGNFNVLLGRGTRLTLPNVPSTVKLPDVFASPTASDRYVGISVSGNNINAEIKPRLRLLPSPYAYLATSALKLTDGQGKPLLDNQAGRVVGNGSGLTNLTAANISGVLGVGIIPNLDANKLTSGTLDPARIPVLDNSKISSLDAAKITAGTLNLARVPLLDNTKIPVLDNSKIPALDSSKIGSLDAGKISSGVMDSARIPTLDVSKITTKTATGVATNLAEVLGPAPRTYHSVNRTDTTTWHGVEVDLTPYLDDDDGCRVWFHLAHETDNDVIRSTTLHFASERSWNSAEKALGTQVFVHGHLLNRDLYGYSDLTWGVAVTKHRNEISSGFCYLTNYRPKEINGGVVDGPVNTGANRYKIWFTMPGTVSGRLIVYDN